MVGTGEGCEMPECEGCGAIYCENCGGAYGEVAGCLEEPLGFLVAGRVRWYAQIPYGSAREARPGEVSGRCPDCACEPGSQHHVGCDQARCPRCLEQFLGCACDLADVEAVTTNQGEAE